MQFSYPLPLPMRDLSIFELRELHDLIEQHRESFIVVG
jgi:hypothetical protein